MRTKDIKILAIETSCDETAAAVIGCAGEISNDQFSVSNQLNNLTMKQWQNKDSKYYPVILSNVVSSQIDLHAKTGGVVPEVASRAHMESIIPVIQEALSQGISNFQFPISNEISNDKISNKANQANSANEANPLSQITHIAVTAGPGLIGSLLVGFNTAKAMAYALDLPIVPINHIEGHIYSALAEQNPNDKIQITNKSQILNSKTNEVPTKQGLPGSRSEGIGTNQANEAIIKFPILALTVSGGHTSLTLMRDHGVYETIGQTRDDAAGEAFDKVAKLLNLGYPGGPAVSRLADEYRKKNPNYKIQISNKIQSSNPKKTNRLTTNNYRLVLPRPMINDKSFDFSFSGLKTAVLDVVRQYSSSESSNREVFDSSRQARTISDNRKAEICAAFEDATVDVLVTKTLRAAEKYQPKSIILAGGVAANKRLRHELADRLSQIPKSKLQISNKFQNPNSKNPNEANEAPKGPLSEGANNLIKLLLPPAELCGDNAAMIGMAAYYHILRGDTKKWNQIKIDSNLKM